MTVAVSEMTQDECISCLEYNGIEADTAKRSVGLYGNNPGKIIGILSDEKRIQLYATTEKLIGALSRKDEYAAAAILTGCTTREDLSAVTAILYERVSEALRELETGENSAQTAPLKKLTKARLYRLYEVLSELMLLDGTNINVKLMQAYMPAKLFGVLE